MRRSAAIRVAAWGVVAAGVAAPLARRRLGMRPAAVIATAAAAPVALTVAVPPSRARHVATCCLQMWAYTAAYKMPADDLSALERRTHTRYPVRADCFIGAGELPTIRLQQWLGRPGEIRAHEKVLVWAHWIWFLVPHGTVAYILWRHPERFTRAAVHTYAVFDTGLIGYWAVPTAPPWYVSGPVAVRRMMVEHGQAFWKGGWDRLYSVFGGNPVAAMPSLHFATSLMAAHLLAELGPVEGALGWSYALTLGFALVYLGEHYVVDLAAGAALTETIRAAGRRLAPAGAAA